MVVKLFSEVKDKSVESPKWEKHPFNEEHFRTCVYMHPIKDVRNLNIVFPCPDLQEYYKSSVSIKLLRHMAKTFYNFLINKNISYFGSIHPIGHN